MTQSPQYTETENRIFEAALHVFSLKGKDGARMQEIADRAGINKAMLHYYFRSKDKLYDEVFTFVIRHFTESFGPDLADCPTFEEVLRRFIEGYIDFVGSHQEIMRLMITEMLAGGPTLREKLPPIIAAPDQLPPGVFLKRLTRAIEAGEVRPVDPIQTMLSIVSSCIFVFIAAPVARQLIPTGFDLDRFLQERKQHIFDLMYSGLKPVPVAV